ncbi:hypothetical protein HJC23_012535, partial [Cyclotella cryptica]
KETNAAGLETGEVEGGVGGGEGPVDEGGSGVRIVVVAGQFGGAGEVHAAEVYDSFVGVEEVPVFGGEDRHDEGKKYNDDTIRRQSNPPIHRQHQFQYQDISQETNTMSEEVNAPDAMQFDHQERDVTCCIEYLCCGNTKLIMGKEEAELKKNPMENLELWILIMFAALSGLLSSLTNNIFFLHYFQHSFVGWYYDEPCPANSLMTKQDSCQATGCGCEEEKVNDIVTELKKRQAFRGDRAKVRLAETTLSSIQDLNAK